MLTPDEFTAQWAGTDHESLRKYPTDAVATLVIPAEEQLVLRDYGLPASTAPYLEFEAPRTAFQTVAEAFEGPEKLARFRIIGSNGEGNPIVIDEQDQGAILVLDQEDGFRRMIMNRSVTQLVESLLAYRLMVRAAVAEHGENAFFENQIPPAAVEALANELRRIDPEAMKRNRFWSQEIENLSMPIEDF
jgi:hypothetical protein